MLRSKRHRPSGIDILDADIQEGSPRIVSWARITEQE